MRAPVRLLLLAVALCAVTAAPAGASVPRTTHPAADPPPSVSDLELRLRTGRIGTGRARLPIRATFSATGVNGIATTGLLIDGSLIVDPPAATPAATTIDTLAIDSASVAHRYTALATDTTDAHGESDTLEVRVWVPKDNAVTFGGSWSQQSATGFYRGSTRWAKAAGRTAQVTVANVTDLAWVSTLGPDRGKAAVSIDGGAAVTVDLYASKLKLRRVVFVAHLSPGSHTLRVRVLGSHRAASSGNRVDIDAFEALRPI